MDTDGNLSYSIFVYVDEYYYSLYLTMYVWLGYSIQKNIFNIGLLDLLGTSQRLKWLKMVLSRLKLKEKQTDFDLKKILDAYNTVSNHIKGQLNVRFLFSWLALCCSLVLNFEQNVSHVNIKQTISKRIISEWDVMLFSLTV